MAFFAGVCFAAVSLAAVFFFGFRYFVHRGVLARLAAGFLGLGHGLLQRGHQVDHLSGGSLLAGHGRGLAVLGFGLDDFDQGVAVVVDELDVVKVLDAHRLKQRERALELLLGGPCRRVFRPSACRSAAGRRP
ncbi:hypothetical protein ACFQ69_24945 [Streptomyces sp. NPDC056470]|uniref:hypothetical protein n=1 Tax=Streptomyces sp. NPDC056470 TaxID=3345831 RepID=UPI00369CD43E